ncbi:MAG: pilus assembly protein TadG-related protein [Bdellovibrionota bacterium]
MKKARGQILIMMAMLTTTLIIFFGMVVAVGHLVQARINLQNSVDFASMVGASYQARFLNGISVVNYRMRQNYKFVLADLYVTQSRFNVGFKNEVLSGGNLYDQVEESGKLVFGICQQYPGYAPNVEIQYGAEARAFPETDMCKFVGASTGIPHIQWTPIPSLNPFVQAISLANLAISEEIKKTCGDAAGQNTGYFRYIMERLAKRNQIQHTALEKMIGEFSNAFSSSPDVLRSNNLADAAVAQTFLDNLISANRAGNQVTLEYINPASTRAPPTGSGSNSVAYFEVNKTQIMVRSVNFVNKGAECVAEILNSRSDEIELGVSRSRATNGSGALNSSLPPKIPLFVALRATVKPHLLFWPTGLTPTLVAVGAAKPFGSRIGPDKELSNLELTGDRRGVGGDNFANISFYPGDYAKQGNGIYGMGHKKILRALYDALGGSSSGRTSLRPSVENNPSFVTFAIAPTLFEGLFWSIFPDPPGQFGRGAADIAMYPNDPPILNILGLGNMGIQGKTAYFLPDRQTSGDEIAAWHFVDPRFGTNGEFRDGNKPLFYADYVSVASAFNPDVYPANPSEVAKALGGGGGSAGSLKGRTGYQIKLTSIPQLCEEIASGDSGSIGSLGAMAKLCQKPYKVWY